MLSNTNKIIKYVHHLADIHIRLDNKRHEEYDQVFNRCYQKIEENKEDSIIVICGDILHSKLELSPECLQLTIKFFKSLANITDVIVIAGNHDFSQNNMDKLDSLTPIIQEIRAINKIFYLKDSGIYTYNNIVFGVSSLIDKNKTFIKATDIKIKNKIKIALYHGMVAGSTDFVGYKFNNYEHVVNDFKGYDYVMLGDIHKHQYLGTVKRICYPSSLIQQNYGESIEDHGYVLWNILTKESTFIRIPNDYCYVTVNVKDGICPEFAATKPRIRLRLENTTKVQYESIKKELHKKYQVQELIYEDITVKQTKVEQKVVAQRDMIINYCNDHYKDNADDIIAYHDYIEKEVTTKNKSETFYKWDLVELSFSNMFCYGANNVINFSKMNGIVGIVAKNGIGKSSIFDAVLYCLFNKCSKGDRLKVINNNSNSYKCKVVLNINGKQYIIKRSGTKNTKNEIKETVNFSIVKPDGVLSLNGKDRIDTNNIITQYIGTYDDCIITSFSLQDEVSFVHYSQSKKKEFLNKLLGLDIFDDFCSYAKSEYKVINSKHKDLMSELVLLDNKKDQKSLIKLQEELAVLESSTIKENLSLLHDTLNDLLLKVYPCDMTVTSLKNIDNKIKGLQNDIKKIKILKSDIDVKKVREKINTLYSNIKKVTEYSTFEKIYDKKQQKLLSITKEIEKKHNLEYDMFCDFCVKNNDLEQFLIKKNKLEEKIKNLDSVLQKQKIEESKQVEIDNKNIRSNIKKLEKQIEEHNEMKENEIKLLKLQQELQKYMIQQDSIKLYKEKIESNEKINIKIKDVKAQISSYTKELETRSHDIIQNNNNQNIVKNRIEKYKKITSELESLTKQKIVAEKYISIVEKNGLPYLSLSNITPQIKNSINEILSMIASFSIDLCLDNDKIFIYKICDNVQQSIEGCCGFEKYIIGLAIRLVLSQFSNINGTNFLILDESFGCMDSTNINSLDNVYNYLRKNFKYIVLISHIQHIRGSCDNLINIVRDGSKSCVNYS